MFKYGLELEVFYSKNKNEIELPPKEYPTDGFPGLIEIRTSGHLLLKDAISDIYSKLHLENIDYNSLLFISEATFTPEQKRELRKRAYIKNSWDIQNIYNKKPRALGNKTIASFQINISYLKSQEYRNKDGIVFPERFSLLDVPKIVKNLDNEFKQEILNSKRQPGEYCVKGDRLEYRSLPNTVFPTSISDSKRLMNRIQKAVEV